jgi:REP element-mobilizing transposase RayT
MPRSLRLQHATAFCHVIARGNRREVLFLHDDDRRFFLHTLGQACEMTGWRVHDWVLMSNHYHLLLQAPEPNLVAGMGWLQNTLTRRPNVRHRKWGGVFGDRCKAVLVKGLSLKCNLIKRRAHGLRSFEALQTALYHKLGDLPEPEITHRFC